MNVYKYMNTVVSIVIIMNFGLSGVSLYVLKCDLCSPIFSVIWGNVVLSPRTTEILL